MFKHLTRAGLPFEMSKENSPVQIPSIFPENSFRVGNKSVRGDFGCSNNGELPYGLFFSPDSLQIIAFRNTCIQALNRQYLITFFFVKLLVRFLTKPLFAECLFRPYLYDKHLFNA